MREIRLSPRFGLSRSRLGGLKLQVKGVLMGRHPWTDRLTVEEVSSLSIRSFIPFTRPSYLGVVPTTLTWDEGNGETGIRCRLTWDQGQLVLQLSNDPTASPVLLEDQVVSTTSTPCNFGGKRLWFACPGLYRQLYGDRYYKGCGRLCTALYLPDGAGAFACRECHGLTYRSTQEHDQRIDRLLRNPHLITYLLGSWNDPGHLLAVRAEDQQLSRMNRRKRPNL
jgi:hypothetical protein